MTNEHDRERILDTIRKLNYPDYKSARNKLEDDNKLNKGVEKALDVFYDVKTLSNGTQISLDSRGRIQVRRNGKFRSRKGLERFINEYKERIKSRG